MTSARGQNVSILQLHGTQPLEPAATAGRSAPINAFRAKRDVFVNGKSSAAGSTDSLSEGFGSGKSPSACVSNSGRSCVNRELSPVRWCDGDVDGVYLGKSGWVQVQQRSSGDSRGTARGQSSAASTLHSPKYHPNFNSNINSLERGERHRPVNLPLSSKRRANPGNHKMPSVFIQEFESVPPPSVTPILSPPPAFRDEQVPSHSARKPHPQDFSQLKPRPVALTARWTLSPVSASKHHSYRCSQTKSLDDNSLERTPNDGHFVSAATSTLFASRSLDNDFGETNSANASDGNCSGVRYFHSPDERTNGSKSEEEDAEDDGTINFCTGFRDRLNAQRHVPNTGRQQKFQPNGKCTAVNDSGCTYRARSSSLDSSSSSNSSGSSSSSSSSGGSVGNRSHHKMSSRRFSTKHCQPQGNGFGGGMGKHFSVKRSRSLQLSEEGPPRELTLMSHSSSGKFCDQVSYECGPFQTNDKNDRHHFQSLRNLHNVMVTVNGQSIPVVSSGDQSLNPLNKITTSEEEQQKLIREAEREARIISQFLSGTRSRVAARNLLIHRYFNRPEAAASDFDEGNVLAKPQCDSRFSRSPRTFHHAPTPPTATDCPRTTLFHPSSHDGRRHTDTPYAKPPSPYTCPSDLPFHYHPTNNTDTYEPPISHLTDSRSKRRHQHQQSVLPSPEKPPATSQRLRSDDLKKPNPPKFQTHPTGANPTPSFKSLPLDTPIDSRQRQLPFSTFRQNSSASSSSSTDAPQRRFPDTTPTTPQMSTASHLSLDSICPRPTSFPSILILSRFPTATNHSTSTPVDQRSLSLPRSFLSERCTLNHFARRNSLPWRQRSPLTPSEQYGEYPAKLQHPTALSTTPVRESRDERSARMPNRVTRKKPSCLTLLNESTLLRPRWSKQKAADKARQKQSCDSISASTLDNRKTAYKKGGAPERATKNFQNSPCQLPTTEQSSPANHRGSFPRETEGRNQETFKGPSTSQSLRSAAPVAGSKKEGKPTGRTFPHDSYDSHDSGIQIGVRGNVDSSESQEDVDSPLLGRLHRGMKICEKVDREGVRRTKSDLGDAGSPSWDAADHRQRFSSNASPSRGSQAATTWTSPDRSFKAQLRRSLSLNELLPRGTQRPSRFECFSEDDNPFEGNSEDELLSDSESSTASSNEREQSLLHSAGKEEAVMFAEAVWDHVAMESFELPFRAGDVVEVLDASDGHWWWGATEWNAGYFPSAFVRLRVNQADAVEDCLAAATPVALEASTKLRRGKSCSHLSAEQIRSSVVRELLNTEREFVKILRGVKDGYIAQCNRRPDMFTSAQICTIFNNLEDILVFQEEFLKDLEGRIDESFPHKSCVGDAFLNNSSGFRMYSEYCNFHPMAMAALQELYQKNKYRKFFEMCRLKQNLTEIPLDGYLLTPVQRICKYPLQLAELLKYTKPDHPDFARVEKALETMRSVATLINERKRKMESLEKLAAWQQRVEGWEGDDLIESSSQLIYQGDVVRITSGMWTTNITLFLFDHQIVYCKKDLLKRNSHIYKGRISLDGSEVMDLPDGKNQQLGVTVKYGIRICSGSGEKWLVFCCRSGEDKAKWLSALEEEKRVVAQDKEVGLDLPPAAKQLAKMGARTKKAIPNKARGKNKMESGHEEMSGLRDGRLSSGKVKGGRRMGTWFTTFGGVMKSPKVGLRHRAAYQQTT